MSWEDRLKDSAYTSPSGVRIDFDFEDVSHSWDKKTTPFNFADADGTYIQDNGNTGRVYPVRAIFSGPDYDLKADAFEEILAERGTGVLETPLYGTNNVVPTGKVNREDRLKNGANEGTVTVLCMSTVGIIYPSSDTDPGADTLSAVDKYNQAAADSFAENSSLASAVEQASFKNTIRSLVGSVRSQMKEIAAAQQDVLDTFNFINDSINESIDLLVSQPLALAQQTILLVQTPARALTNIQARLSSFGGLSGSTINGIVPGAKATTAGEFGSVFEPGYDSQSSNNFQANDLIAASAVTGSILSALNNQFETKSEALEASAAILAQLESAVNWREANFNALGQVDTGESFQQLQEAAAAAAGFLVQISFDLNQERTITLTRDQTFIDLCAELYGENDAKHDFFIRSNDLSGSEHIEIKAGRKIVYYI